MTFDEQEADLRAEIEYRRRHVENSLRDLTSAALNYSVDVDALADSESALVMLRSKELEAMRLKVAVEAGDRFVTGTQTIRDGYPVLD